MGAPRAALPAAVLAGACVLAFARTAGLGFLIWDERAFIAADPLTAHPSPASLAALSTTPLYGLHAPLTYTLWALVAAVFGPQAWAFHLTNVALHALAACAVWALLRHLFGNREPTAALAGALLFAVHPLQTEAVAWASATKDLLSALCSFLAIRQYLLFRERAGRRFHLAASAAFAGALLAKPAAVYVPALLDAAREFGLAARIVPGYVAAVSEPRIAADERGPLPRCRAGLRQGLAVSPTDEALRTQLGVAVSKAGGWRMDGKRGRRSDVGFDQGSAAL